MPTKIRLSRHGRKRNPYYHILVADSRAPRDGRFIERIGSYDPTTNPATIDLDFDKALDWMQKGAVPTETCRAILSYEGVLLKKHLLDGVKKGAFDEATAEAKFEAWKRDNLAKIRAKRDRLVNESSEDLKKRKEAEAKVKEAKAAIIAKKNAKLAAADQEEEVGVEEEVAVAEEAAEAVVEEVVAEVKEEAAPEETTEETKEEEPEKKEE